MIVNVSYSHFTSFLTKLKLGKFYVTSYTFLLVLKALESNNISTLKELRIQWER